MNAPLNEWGLAERVGVGDVAPTPAQSPTGTIVGSLAGAVAGAYVGHLIAPGMAGAGLGAALGGAAGGYAGYSATKPQAAPAPSTPTPSPTPAPTSSAGVGTLPAGPYTPVAAGSQMQTGGVYIASGQYTLSQGETMPTAQQLLQQEAAAQGNAASAAIQSIWVGGAPSGWPANDPNLAPAKVATAVFVAMKMGSQTMACCGEFSNVWAAAGTATPGV